MKHFKMVLYGEPGVGKSVFASKAPKPFFIATDGNYEWLEEFGANPEDHVEVSSWSQAKKEFAKSFDNYETIVVDLAEDLFKWCEYEYCTKNKFDHVSDLGYGKGYDITRNEYFLEICKLFAKEKNIILIMHGNTYVVKDRRGIEHTHYGVTNRMPDKLIDMIEGRVRYFLRCYLKAEEQADGTVQKKRYLSLIPKENEFGICRGIDETKVPQDIALDFETFAKTIGLDVSEQIESKSRKRRKQVEIKDEDQLNIDTQETDTEVADQQEAVVESDTTNISQKEDQIEETAVKEEVRQETKKTEEPQTVLSNADKLAAIKAKLAALKNKN